MIPRTHKEVIEQLVALQDQRVLDVGCGNGAMARLLARRGARVTGVDPQPHQIERAKAEEAVGQETYVVAGGEALPFEEASFETVLFFNSLHHVPLSLQAKSLEEARRVLVREGNLLVVEPVAAGGQFELMRSVDDETAVRAHAYGILNAAHWLGFEPQREVHYDRDLVHGDFNTFMERSVQVNPARREKMEAQRQTLEDAFQRIGEKQEDGYHFVQPMRANLFRKSRAAF